MSTITSLTGSTPVTTAGAATIINTNFSNLNTDKIETSVLDTDTTLAANSDAKVATQKAVKAYVDSGGNPNASTIARGIVEEATQAELTAGTQTGGSGARLFLNPVHTTSTSAGAADAGKIPRLNASGQLDSTIVASSFPVQDVDILANNTLANPNMNNTYITSNSTGTVLFLCYASTSTNLVITRIVKDGSTSNYYKTHTTNLTITGSEFYGSAVLGNYLYVFVGVAGPTGAVRRYDIADLANVTSMTISGSNIIRTYNGAVWSDGTQLWYYSNTDVYTQHTISGTTITNTGTTRSYTSTLNPYSAISNGTNVWITQNIGTNADPTISIRKYAVAGGAVVSTTTIVLATDANKAPAPINVFLASTGFLGIGWTYNSVSDTAVIGIKLRLMAITLP